MINKNMFVKLWLFAFAVLGVSLSSTSAVGLVFRNDINVDFGNMETVAISFKDNWNDFWGAMIFFKGGNSITGEVEIEVSDGVISRYECERQLKWFYYNAERWDRLWPLDSDIMEKVQSEWLSMWADAPIGGLYTNCRRTILDNGQTYDEALTECDTDEENDTEEKKVECREKVEEKYALWNYYYGMITRKYQGIESHIVAWTDYKLGTPWIVIDDDKGFWDTLVSIQTSAPVWFIYDDNGGVGFMHCNPESAILIKILNMLNNEHKELWDLFKLSWDMLIWNEEVWGTEITQTDIYCGAPWSLAWSLLWVVIEGLVWKTSDKFWISAAEDPKMQYFSSVSVNNATLLNFTKKKAEALCRWRWGTVSETVACLSGASSEWVDASLYKGKTLIVKNWNVVVSPADSYDDKYYDIFIENGDLIIQEDPAPNKFVFKKDWFIKDMDIADFNHRIENNLSWWCKLSMRTWEEAAVASLLKWNFIVDWHVRWKDSSNLKNKYFIHGKFTSKDSYDDLLGSFEWRCWSDGKSAVSDASWERDYCPSCNGEITTECWDGEEHFPVHEECSYRNYYTNSPLVVVDQKFDSPLFR